MKETNETVLGFIHDFLHHNTKSEEDREMLSSLFMAGYCYYFAAMLQKAFNRGTICWCAPYSHFIWMDNDGVPYDIEGRSKCEAEYFIPEEYLGEAADDFKHIPGKVFCASQEQVNEIIERHKKSSNLKT